MIHMEEWGRGELLRIVAWPCLLAGEGGREVGRWGGAGSNVVA